MIKSLNNSRVDGSSYPSSDSSMAVKIIDHSVNHAQVSIEDNKIMLMNSVASNSAGNFNGGGTGNKAIASLSCGMEDMLISLMPTIEYKFQLSPTMTLDNASAYLNAILDLNGDGSVYKIMALMFMSVTPNLDNTGTRIDLGNGLYHLSFDKLINDVAIVGSPLAGVTPVVGTDLDVWGNRRYTIDDIAAVYPSCKFVKALSLDGGMPKSIKTAPLVLGSGDSATNTRRLIEVYDMKINGLDVQFRV